MKKKLVGVIALMLSVTAIVSCDACVTVNTQQGTYVVDESGCVNLK